MFEKESVKSLMALAHLKLCGTLATDALRDCLMCVALKCIVFQTCKCLIKDYQQNNVLYAILLVCFFFLPLELKFSKCNVS